MKVALVYDRVTKWGGAERVLLALHKMFPAMPLYTSVYDKKNALWASVFDVKTSFLQKLPISYKHELYPFLMPFAFESFSFDEYDLVISVTSEAAKGIITKGKTKHICYCLTPTRYLWSGHNEYFSNAFFRFLSQPVISYLRRWDRVAAQRPDVYIAISKEVQDRIKKYYDRESEVIYPPVSLSAEVAHENFLVACAKKQEAKFQNFDPANSHSENFVGSPRPGFFLVVSRLVPYKRIDIAIEACNALQLPLYIVGVGSEDKKLKRLAGPTVKFLGALTDTELVGYYKACRALLFPGDEDFGLAMVEAQRFGKPVIAFRNGGAREIIIDGKTGLFFYPQTKEACRQAILRFDTREFSKLLCIQNAERFSLQKFKKEFTETIKKIMTENKVDIL